MEELLVWLIGMAVIAAIVIAIVVFVVVYIVIPFLLLIIGAGLIYGGFVALGNYGKAFNEVVIQGNRE